MRYRPPKTVFGAMDGGKDDMDTAERDLPKRR
jgi:hypothetical protein